MSKPLVYSCSGCSSAAQMANDMALKLDREGHADMSCISGVGGGVPSLVSLAKSGRPILALDGCPLHCVAECLRQRGVSPFHHVDLGALGVKKLKHADYDRDEFDALYPRVVVTAKNLGG